MQINIKFKLTVNEVVKLLLIFLFVLNASGGLFAPLYAVFVIKSLVGADLKTVGFAVALYAIVKSILQIPIARKIDKKDGERDDFYVMFAGAIVGVIYPLALFLIKFPWQLFIVEAMNGVGSACLMAAYYGVFSRHIDRGSEGFEWSMFSVWGLTISAALGGAMGGIIADAIGIRSTFLISAFLNLLALFLLVVLYPRLDGTRRKAPPPPIPIP